MKSDEERRNEILAFAGFGPERQREEMDKLRARVKAIGDEIISNQKAIEVCHKGLKEHEQDLASDKTKYSAARAKRQNLFALRMSTKEVDEEIRKLQLDMEDRQTMWTDAIAGFNSRLSDLSKEVAFLEEERDDAKRTILEFEQVPLVPKFNREIAQAMRTFEQIYEGQESLDYALKHPRVEGFTMIQLSDWEWLEHVGKLYLVGEIANEDQLGFGRMRWTWNFREYIERRRKEREKAASE